MAGWIALVPIALSCVMIALALHERGQRKGLEEAERLYAPVLELVTKWAEIHLAWEKRTASPAQPHHKEREEHGE